MDTRSSHSLITRVVVALCVVVMGLLATMAVGAGLVKISPALIFKGVFLCLVGGALYLMIRACVAAHMELDEQGAAEVDGSK
ncbi:hypothetical protein C206_02304 [Pseudomonas putida TRO1]|uniref:Uncharacterized protein n=2 Tax=Pseudomonas putida TaxID=303 RepID=A0A1L7NPF7_PSEPU|nr:MULTISPECIES: hypothetical protein [Pseudomonas]HCF2575605.1 hypothetical protein [Pseudomonas aeruginosa]ELS0926981.1 hypothetical protein [Pseudomonas putida]ENY79389.1 hypothetical protein C206_02304 [Pseudomonas putida TRO1]MBA1319955.1 hypothetical protein [Pseudomonas monteilii]POF99444.1 hypothetical protein BGP82_26625 [Pseudomonas putida]